MFKVEEPVLEENILKAEDTAGMKPKMDSPPPPAAADNKKLNGMVFTITGRLLTKRKDFVQILQNNGGIMKGSITKDVTHLIATRNNSGKYLKAIAGGVEILSESQILEKIRSSNEDGRVDYHESKTEDGQPSSKHGMTLSATADALRDKILRPTGRVCNFDSQKGRSTIVSKVEEPVLGEGGSGATGKENAIESVAIKTPVGIEHEMEVPALDMEETTRSQPKIQRNHAMKLRRKHR